MRSVLTVVLALVVGIAIGVAGDHFLRPATQAARTFPSWQIVAQPGAGHHAWRLHTVTGEVDFCSVEETGDWKCRPVDAWTTGSGGRD
jgi:hypothetical protein